MFSVIAVKFLVTDGRTRSLSCETHGRIS